MRQTFAIFVDAYRELNSKKLFWISMAISLAVVAALAIPTQTQGGLSIFGAKLENGPFQLLGSKGVSPAAFYKFIYSWIGINLWLGWGATILALISTASMIPDLVSSGSIELTLSKPLARLRLFLTKYAAGLVFVGLQAGVFALGTILVIGLRSGTWDARPLLVVPIMILFFSFLHCISVLVGLITRSTLMALLAVVLVWLGIWAVQTTEGVLFDQRVQSERQITRTDEQLKALRTGLDQFKAQLNRLQPNAPTTPQADTSTPSSTDAKPDAASSSAPAAQSADVSTPPAPPAPPDRRGNSRRQMQRDTNRLLENGKRMFEAMTTQDPEQIRAQIRSYESQIAAVERIRPEQETSATNMRRWHTRLYVAFTALPKTGATKELFQRWVIDKSDWDGFLKVLDEMGGGGDGGRDTQEELNKRPLWWILGTSLAFEAFILAIACWIFCRRDF
ncbi:MAG: ABC transporter permease [Phycisphaerales bacterium]|nr:ABC transporter permease [Phycisphaerales bacterium]